MEHFCIISHEITKITGIGYENEMQQYGSFGTSSTKSQIHSLQELGITFDTRTQVEKIQILASKFMVSSAIDIFIGDDTKNPEDPIYKKAKFISLGEIKFNDPESSKYNGRQMQTIELQGNEDLKIFSSNFSSNKITCTRKMNLIKSV